MQRWEQRGLRPQLHLYQHAGEQSCPAPLPGVRGHSAPLILPLPSLSQGSYKCGPCKSGFVGNQTSGCIPQKSCSTPTSNPCDINGFCVFERNGEISCAVSGGQEQEDGKAGGWQGVSARAALGPARAPPSFPAPDFFFLQCNVGWAGNGNVCGQDTDLDGYPDEPLPCIDNNKHCKQVGVPEREGSILGQGVLGLGEPVAGLCFRPHLLPIFNAGCACRTTAA